MRPCRFCSRWFKNKQAVRRHLGYCPTYQAQPGRKRWERVDLYQCASCLDWLGSEQAAKLSEAEMYATAGTGCPSCGWRGPWTSAGWTLVPGGAGAQP